MESMRLEKITFCFLSQLQTFLNCSAVFVFTEHHTIFDIAPQPFEIRLAEFRLKFSDVKLLQVFQVCGSTDLGCCLDVFTSTGGLNCILCGSCCLGSLCSEVALDFECLGWGGALDEVNIDWGLPTVLDFLLLGVRILPPEQGHRQEVVLLLVRLQAFEASDDTLGICVFTNNFLVLLFRFLHDSLVDRLAG